jgi:hypothetical protein
MDHIERRREVFEQPYLRHAPAAGELACGNAVER